MNRSGFLSDIKRFDIWPPNGAADNQLIIVNWP